MASDEQILKEAEFREAFLANERQVRINTGKLAKDPGVADAANPWRKVPYLVLLAALLLFGFFPRLLTDKIKPAAALVVMLPLRR